MRVLFRSTRPVLGMFLGGAGLADSILFCRHKIYPLGLPNSLSHALTVLALILTAIFGARASFLPSRPRPVSVSVHRQGELSGRFALLMVTTLERLLLNTKPRNNATSIGALKLMAIERSEEHTSELQSLMRISYAVFCLKKNNNTTTINLTTTMYTN